MHRTARFNALTLLMAITGLDTSRHTTSDVSRKATIADLRHLPPHLQRDLGLRDADYRDGKIR